MAGPGMGEGAQAAGRPGVSGGASAVESHCSLGHTYCSNAYCLLLSWTRASSSSFFFFLKT